MIAVNQLISLSSTLILALGKPLPVQISGNEVWISDPQIAKAQALSGNRVLLTGKALGEVYVHGIYTENPTTRAIVTTPENLSALEKCPDSKKHLQAHLDGTLRAQIWNTEFKNTIKDCGFNYLSLEDLNSLNSYFKNKDSEFSKSGLSLSSATLNDGRIEWHIRRQDLSKISILLKDVLPFIELKTSSHKVQNSIIFQLDLFEFSGSEMGGSEISASTNPEIIGSSLIPKSKLALFFAKAKNNGRLLASPKIRTIPGKNATFTSGGEIPIQDAQFVGTKTTWKNYGLKIDLTPSPDSHPLSSEIATQVEIQYLQPDFGNSQENIPAMVKRELKSDFVLPTSTTTVLTSMIYFRDNKGSKKHFGIGAIPLIGSIFSNHNEQLNQNELWFLVTPTWSQTLNVNQISKSWVNHGKQN